MISSLLSRLFWWAFILIIIGGMGDIISQITVKPLKFSTGKNSVWILGKPGLVVNTRIVSSPERLAPDTTVEYTSNDTTGRQVSGVLSLNEDYFHSYHDDLKKLIEEKKLSTD